MTSLITKTKILPPRRQDNLLGRQRVSDALNSMLSARLLLVVAPAGYGKTSALIDWLDSLDRAVCWYTVDALDEDPHRFIAHWFAAISETFPRFGLQSNAMLQAYAGQQATLDQLVTTAVNELYATVDEEFVLVADDYHMVDGVGEIGYFVSRFIQNVAPNCHVALTSRKLLALPNLALFVARSQVAGLDDATLAFTAAEVAALVEQRFNQTLTPAAIEQLAEATEGWVTGLLLSAQATRIPTGMRRIRRAAGVDLYDYLAHQVLDQQPDYLRAFLLRVAVLEEFDAELCSTIFNPEWLPVGRTWQDLLDEVLDKGLFVVAVGEDGAWLRFHRLFQEFLLHRFGQSNVAEMTLILQRLAAWLQAHQEWDRAYQLYHRLHDQAAITDLLIAAGPPLIKQGRAHILDRWTEEVIAMHAAPRPELLAIRAAALVLLGRMQEGTTLLDRAGAQLTAADGVWYLRALAWRAVVLRYKGDYGAAISQCNDGLAIGATLDDHIATSPNPAQDEAHLEHAVTEITALFHKTLAICLLKQGHLRQALNEFMRALTLYEIAGSDVDVAGVRLDLAVAQMNMGDMAHAQENFEFCANSWRRLGHIHHLSLVLNNLGVLYHRQGKLYQAVETYAEALVNAERSAHRRTEALVCASLADLLADLDFFHAADVLYARGAKTAAEVSHHFLELYINLQRAHVASLAGTAEQAYHYIDQAGQHAFAERSGYDHTLYQLAVGRIHLMHGRSAMALDALTAALARLEADEHLLDADIARLWVAAAHQAELEHRAAAEVFQAIIGQWQNQASVFSASLAARPIAPLLSAIKVDSAHTAARDRFFDEFAAFRSRLSAMRRTVRQNAPEPLAELLAEAPTLQIRTFGRTEVRINGRQITNNDWKTLVSRDIFFCLLSHPEGLTREELCAIFWPDASPEQLKTRFKNSMYRLRTAVGSDTIVFVDDLYRLNPLIDYEYDVDGFLHWLDRARQAEDPADKSRALARAVADVHGEYCPEIEDEWAYIERRRLDRRLREALSTLATLYYDLQQLSKARALCDRMLVHDNCWEEAHRLLMLIHAAEGNRAEVTRQFTVCRQTLQQEIDAHPSRHTEELYAQLMA